MRNPYSLVAHRNYMRSLYSLPRGDAAEVSAAVRLLLADPGGLGVIVAGEWGFVLRRYSFGRYRVLYEIVQQAGQAVGGSIRLLSLEWDE